MSKDGTPIELSKRAPLSIEFVALSDVAVMLCLARIGVFLEVGRILQDCSAAMVWTAGHNIACRHCRAGRVYKQTRISNK